MGAVCMYVCLIVQALIEFASDKICHHYRTTKNYKDKCMDGQRRKLAAYTFLSPTYIQVSRRCDVIALSGLLVGNSLLSPCAQNNQSTVYTVASTQPCQRLTVDRGHCEQCCSFKVHWSSAQYIYWNTWKNRRTAAQRSQNNNLTSKQGNTLASLMMIPYYLSIQS